VTVIDLEEGDGRQILVAFINKDMSVAHQ